MALICRSICACLVAALLLPALSLAADPGEKNHLVLAEQLVKELSPDQTSYRHKNQTITLGSGREPSQAHTDCSGFVTQLLIAAYGLSDRELEQWFGRKRPTARRYYQTINDGTGFVRIQSVSGLVAGDLIAIAYPPGSRNTGHLMIVSARPERRTASQPLAEGTEQWSVPVIDASESGHGSSDTRRSADGHYSGGVGTGIFRLYAAPDGTVAGYAWSTFATSRYYPVSERPLAMGRLNRGYLQIRSP